MRISLLIGILSALALSGCGGTFNTKALQQHNRFAVVSVTGLSSGFGFSEAEETRLVTSAGALVVRELRASRRFELVTPVLVTRDRNYVAIKGESTSGLLTSKVADGYKKFDVTTESGAMNGLRKDLKLTGVINVTLAFTKKSSGLSLSGILPIPIPVSVGSTRGDVTLTIVAYDANNDVIWSDNVDALTRDSVGSVMGLSNLQSLHPQLLDAARDATRAALHNLDEKMTASN